MKRTIFRKGWVIFASLLLLLLPAVVSAQTDGAQSSQPPIAQQLVREGNLATQLTAALGLGTYNDEAEAESVLAGAGIVPKNGWIADYPVTPDIVGELDKSVGEAADARKITLGRDEALKKLRDVVAGMSLAVSPSGADQPAEVLPAEAGTYPDETVLEDYYVTEGPPVVTYYAPPPDYYYLYSWVPYPFWFGGFGFSGFFILNDFHRRCFFGNNVFFVSNHFRDFRSNRVFRVDPVGRFHGKTFAGIGVTNRHGFNSTVGSRGGRNDLNVTRTTSSQGFSRGGRQDLNGSRNQGSQAFSRSGQGGRQDLNSSRNQGSQALSRGGPGGRTDGPAFGTVNTSGPRGGRAAAVQTSGSRNASFAPSSMRSMGNPSFGGGRPSGATFSGGSRGGGFSGSPASFRGGGFSGSSGGFRSGGFSGSSGGFRGGGFSGSSGGSRGGGRR